MPKILGHELTRTQARASVIGAASGVALLVIAIASMKKGGGEATQGKAAVSSGDAQAAFDQGYNAAATAADSGSAKPAISIGDLLAVFDKRAAATADAAKTASELPSPWDVLPSASTNPAPSRLTPTTYAAPATAGAPLAIAAPAATRDARIAATIAAETSQALRMERDAIEPKEPQPGEVAGRDTSGQWEIVRREDGGTFVRPFA